MYIVIDYGVPHVASELQPISMNRLAAIQKAWTGCWAYDENARFELAPDSEVSFSLLQNVLARTFYNPKEAVVAQWHSVGPMVLQDIVNAVEQGLERDDDIIQQWFGAEDVLKLLRSASSFDEMVDRVNCIYGGFEEDSRLQAIVEQVL